MIGVVTSVAYLEVRSLERHIDGDLVDAARLGAQSAAEILAEQTPPLDPLDIRDTLHDLVEADPVLDAISVIEADETGHLRVFTEHLDGRARRGPRPRGTGHDQPGSPPASAAAPW